jgi:hypothetical protein
MLARFWLGAPCRPPQGRTRCGILPVVDEGGHLAGVVTDWDICIALATRNRRASDLAVGEVVQALAFTVSADDDVHAGAGRDAAAPGAQVFGIDLSLGRSFSWRPRSWGRRSAHRAAPAPGS